MSSSRWVSAVGIGLVAGALVLASGGTSAAATRDDPGVGMAAAAPDDHDREGAKGTKRPKADADVKASPGKKAGKGKKPQPTPSHQFESGSYDAVSRDAQTLGRARAHSAAVPTATPGTVTFSRNLLAYGAR